MATKKADPRPKPIDGEERPRFELCNRTELQAIAQFNEIPGATSAIPREVLLQAILSMEPIEEKNPVDQLRDRLIQWIRRPEVWDSVRMGLPFNRCPDCYNSCDVQVMVCYLDNKRQMT